MLRRVPGVQKHSINVDYNNPHFINEKTEILTCPVSVVQDSNPDRLTPVSSFILGDLKTNIEVLKKCYLITTIF